MPVNATPARPPVLTKDLVRMFLRDVPGKIPGTGQENILLDDVEFSEEELENAIRFTTSRYNCMTPVTRKTPDAIQEYILLVGTAAFLMKSEVFRQARNQSSTQDGDVQGVARDDKAPLYQAIAQHLDEEFERYARGVKTEENMRKAYGGLSSGYSTVSRRFG
jgi:hypothetical protein